MRNLIYLDLSPVRLRPLEQVLHDQYKVHHVQGVFDMMEYLTTHPQFELVVCHGILSSDDTLAAIQKVMPVLKRSGVPAVLVAPSFSFTDKKVAVKEGISSIFEVADVQLPDFITSLNKIIENPPIRIAQGEAQDLPVEHPEFKYKPRFLKRAFDIVVSGMFILVFSPVYLLLALLIRLESKGPIFYISKRVGAGYQIFDFYKFRSMIPDADARLKQLSHLNQYATAAAEEAPVVVQDFVKCADCIAEHKECENLLYDDTGMPRCEKVYLEQKKQAKDTFFKISNDPRVTRLGKFLRNSSLDEIPQMFNVFKGDMSIVGNRPLPLYEAEKLTKDMFAKRFLAPAGITGLWQVTKRGKGGPMSEEERMALDNTYADHFSFWFDIKLILKTIPALFQKDNV